MDIEVVKKPRSDTNRSLFLFVRRNNGRYVLYMIDAIRLFRERITEEPLSPLVFFSRHVLPRGPCAFAYIEPNFYIVGEERNEVFALNKYSVCSLNPRERRRGNEFLNPVGSPMLGKKSDPLAFGFNGNLYVVSKRNSSRGPKQHSFEFYSTLSHTWTDLFPKPIWQSSIKTHVVHENMVYFCLSNHTIMSFNLRISKWSTVYDPYGVLYIHKHLHPRYTVSHPPPTFDSNIGVFGNIIFGVVLGSEHFHIFASQNFMPFENFFLRPTLAPSRDFRNALDTQTAENPSSSSKYIVNVDGIMCVVCYGNLPSRGLSNHAVLNFFDVSNDLHQPLSGSGSGSTTLAEVPFGGFSFDAMEEDGQDVNYFKADFISRTQLPINTRRKSTHGTLCSCLLV